MKGKLFDRIPGGTLIYNFRHVLEHIKKRKLYFGDLEFMMVYFLGARLTYSIYYNFLERKYSDRGCLNFGHFKLPKVYSITEKCSFIDQYLDIVYPFINRKYDRIEGEGPYFFDKVIVERGDVVIDAGANIGMFSAVAAALGGSVYAFEPLDYVRERFLELTAKLNKDIKIVPMALSNQSGIQKMKIDLRNIDGSSLIKLPKYYKEVDIYSISLDEWVKLNGIKKINFIKADIEGAERLMLEGASFILKEYAPKLSLCIYHFDDDKKILKEIILKANPKYKIFYNWKKLYAYVE